MQTAKGMGGVTLNVGDHVAHVDGRSVHLSVIVDIRHNRHHVEESYIGGTLFPARDWETVTVVYDRLGFTDTSIPGPVAWNKKPRRSTSEVTGKFIRIDIEQYR